MNQTNHKNQSSDNFSGLPRRSCLTARNNVVPFCELCVSFANLAVKKIKPQRTQRKNPENLKNLTKILVQTNTHVSRHCEERSNPEI